KGQLTSGLNQMVPAYSNLVYVIRQSTTPTLIERMAKLCKSSGGLPLRKICIGLLCACAILLLQTNRISAQQAEPQPLTLNQAIDLALSNYPSIRASRAQAKAADAGVEVAQTAYLPRTDLLWQENRATRNNIFGLLLPQSVIPPISGPVLGTNSFT